VGVCGDDAIGAESGVDIGVGVAESQAVLACALQGRGQS